MRLHAASPAGLANLVGDEAIGEWFTIDQARIDAFADATDDHQWIHVDLVRAASGPFGGTIAHGYLTLSLLSRLTMDLISVDHAGMVVNYGLDRVRFLHPVAAGSRVRARLTLAAVEEVRSGIRAALDVTVDIDGLDQPALVARSLALYVPAPRTDALEEGGNG